MIPFCYSDDYNIRMNAFLIYFYFSTKQVKMLYIIINNALMTFSKKNQKLINLSNYVPNYKEKIVLVRFLVPY